MILPHRSPLLGQDCSISLSLSARFRLNCFVPKGGCVRSHVRTFNLVAASTGGGGRGAETFVVLFITKLRGGYMIVTNGVVSLGRHLVSHANAASGF